MKQLEGRVELPSRWDIPPECGGQICEVSYGEGLMDGDEPVICRREVDRSDGSEVVTVYQHPDDIEIGGIDPWNGEPKLGSLIGEIS